ncbi:MAG: permease-like cell division protein FtsX [Myxococcota bacterium]|nr:permease-like cell division protein FtsX [Myxococcota bacterium]
MSRIAARVLYFGRTALRGISASPITSAVAVATIAVCLVLVGGFALLVFNMEGLLDRFGGDLHVTAYLEPELSDARQLELAEVARSVEGVAAVRLVSADEAFERFRAGVARGADYLDGLGENPLPASLELALAPESQSAAGMAVVVESLDGLSGIDELSSGQDWVEGYLRALALVRGLGVGLGAILAVATLLIVANTIRLAVVARRDEIEILSLVGASPAFVRGPFLLEGLVQGAAGGALALLLLFGLFHLVLPSIAFGLELVLGGVAPSFFSGGQALGLVGSGALLGLLGAGGALAGDLRS